MMAARSGLALWVLTSGLAAHADVPPIPVLPPEDTNTAGTARHSPLDVLATYAAVVGHDAPAAHLIELQASAGPLELTGMAHDAFGFLDGYALRVRQTLIASNTGDDTHAGPLTLALQRFVPIAPLQIAPLLTVNFGVEAAVSTPWLGDSARAAPAVLGQVTAVDTELAQNGWSLRPSGFFRFDFLVCRSFYLELGAGPEAFVPTSPQQATEYDLRYHVAFGANLGCRGREDSVSRHVTVVVEYRGRERLYQAGAPADYHDQLAGALQYHWTHVALGAFAAYDPLFTTRDAMIGGRLEIVL